MSVYFDKIFKKKKPIEIFSKIKKPHLEEAYIKFPGNKTRSISKKRGTHYVNSNNLLIDKLQKKYGLKYTGIHTHPEGDLAPSPKDLTKFLGLDEQKCAIIIPLDKNNNQPKGYFVMKKNRTYKLSTEEKQRLVENIQPYRQCMMSENPQIIASGLKDLAKKYNFSYRFFPAHGTKLTENAQGFKNSRTSLEIKLSAIIILSLFLSILLTFPNITGSIILEVHGNISKAIPTVLFIIIGVYLTILPFFRNKAKI